MKRLLVAVAVAAMFSAAPVHADPNGPGPGQCEFLGAKYNVWYPCDEYQPWLPYGTADNPPYGSALPPQDCTGISIHDVGCS